MVRCDSLNSVPRFFIFLNIGVFSDSKYNQNKKLVMTLGDSSNKDDWEKKYLFPPIIEDHTQLILDELGHRGHTNIFKLRLFNEVFAKELLELCEGHGRWGERNWAAYPTNDIWLEDIGLGPIYESFLRLHVYPLIRETWMLNNDPWQSMTVESQTFVAKYDTNNQFHLDLHHDDSIVTLVVGLNTEFEGGGTYFYNQRSLINLEIGEAIFHPGGLTHLHGARPVTSGTRYTLVSFIRPMFAN